MKHTQSFHKSLPYLEQFRHLQRYLLLGGIKAPAKLVYLFLLGGAAIIDISILSYFIGLVWEYKLRVLYLIIITLVMFSLGYFLIFMVFWLLFLLILDYLKFKRRAELEEILPEFLRLVSANHRAGLPLDVSLWKANRPRFGILSVEVDELARKTYATGDLMGPLEEFGRKYDSPLLMRVISNLIEGLKTGSDIASLLDDVSNNVRTIKNTRKELASEVENYMLFITITVLIISPLMFSLTSKMAELIEGVKSILLSSGTEQAASTVEMPFKITQSNVGKPFQYYFDIFVYLMTATSSVVSVLLMSTIKYGNIQSELKKIPVYFVISLVCYTLFKLMFSNFIKI
ncbi:MAG: type II secretion system F family protein [Nanoarchaeota archaeon]|nr:type II secretion system F family protein [Nanoarchaeota archaeon]